MPSQNCFSLLGSESQAVIPKLIGFWCTTPVRLLPCFIIRAGLRQMLQLFIIGYLKIYLDSRIGNEENALLPFLV